MKKIRVSHNPYLLFLPFLIVFIIYVFIQPPNLSGDELRYLSYARRLLQGYYSPREELYIINGPGYPILLLPFVAFKLPLICITVMNAFYYYLSIILLYKSLNLIVTHKTTLIFSFAWASYIIAYVNIPNIYTETFTYLLISLFVYSTLKVFCSNKSNTKNTYIILTGFVFGYIILTKMIFGYVLMFSFVLNLFLWIFQRGNLNYRKSLIILVVAFLTTSPYLFYTYNLTGRLFYWGMGSDSLYWMSTPYEKEYGDWIDTQIGNNPKFMVNATIPVGDSLLKANHREDFNLINKYSGIEKDDIYKKLAIRNIKSHPIKYAKNIVYNLGRLVFNYPYTLKIEEPRIILVFLINGILLTMIIFSLILTFLNWTKFPFYLKFLLIILSLYLGATMLVSALIRMFTVVVPIIILWIAFVLQETLKVSLKFNKKFN